MKLALDKNLALTFDAATERIQQLQQNDQHDIHPQCHLRFLSHSQQVDRAIVLFHGYTASPYQFHRLGEYFYKQGYNVLIPRIKHHGLKDRLDTQHASLTADDLVRDAVQAIDIAQGLGEQVDVMGLSMGGVMTAWAAQYRADVRRAVIIAPAMGLHIVPHILTRLAMGVIKITPNRFGWWDPAQKEALPYPPYDYPRFATRTLAQFLDLGFQIRKQASKQTPAAESVIMVTNANDVAVNNKAAQDLVRRWRKSGATHVRTCEFTITQQLAHDFIDPAKDTTQSALTYPVLLDLVMR